MFWTGTIVGAAVAALVIVPAGIAALLRAQRRARLGERRASRAERMAEIGAMTGGLAHEIKNPLSTIGLNAQLLGEAVAELPVDQAERDRLLRRIGVLRREVERLRDILESFLRYAGQMRLERRATDLGELLDDLADFFMPQAQKQGVRLSVDKGRAPVVAHVDPDQLKQALLNLMINATQAMAAQPDGPQARPRELMLRLEQNREPGGRQAARLRVTDTGPGIAAEALEKIFQPYFTTKPGGSGLGLPITKRIVEEHGGRIDVHSEPGRGTEFVISLEESPA